MESLYDKLTAYGNSDFYGFHMPGHKRNVEVLGVDLPYEIDITEIDGFDDLHHADGILKDAEERAAKVYHADETHFLVNGSTCGIMSAIMGCTRKGDSILVARNCHKSIYHAMYLNELKPVYVYPEFEAELELNGEVSASDVKAALEANPGIKVVMIVSPTYDGVVSDVAAIARAAHDYGAVLIVDEAHGAHLGFDPYFPENANVKGADVVIHSVHKTMPALTQTALIHMNGELVNRGRVKRYLHMLQTSSPSYVLMASIDSCMEMLADGGRRGELFASYVEMLKDTREKLQGLKHLQILETKHFDLSKIVVSVKNVGCVKKDSETKGSEIKDVEQRAAKALGDASGYTSRGLYRELIEKNHLQMEMVAGSYVLAMTTVGDTREGMDRLVDALFEIDERLSRVSQGDSSLGEKVSQGDGSCGKKVSQGDGSLGTKVSQGDRPLGTAEVVYTIADVMDKKYDGETKAMTFPESVGYISTEFAYLYPPGTPILVPGERVTKDVVRVLEEYRNLGFQIEGLEQEDKIEVWHG